MWQAAYAEYNPFENKITEERLIKKIKKNKKIREDDKTKAIEILTKKPFLIYFAPHKYYPSSLELEIFVEGTLMYFDVKDTTHFEKLLETLALPNPPHITELHDYGWLPHSFVHLELPPIELPTPKKETFARDDIDFQFKEMLGCGKTGKVYRGKYKSKDVAIKVCNNSTEERKYFENEASVYEHLFHLQGDYIPSIAGFGEYEDGYNDKSLVLIMNDIGHKQKAEDITENDVERIYNGLIEIHKNGIVWGDAELKNVLRKDNGDIMLIDFAYARVSPSNYEFRAEANHLGRSITRKNF